MASFIMNYSDSLLRAQTYFKSKNTLSKLQNVSFIDIMSLSSFNFSINLSLLIWQTNYAYYLEYQILEEVLFRKCIMLTKSRCTFLFTLVHYFLALHRQCLPTTSLVYNMTRMFMIWVSSFTSLSSNWANGIFH